MLFKGAGVAIITPMNKDGEVDLERYAELINFHIENNTDAIISLGTTGEASTISDEDKLRVAETAIKTADGRIPVIVGTGTNDTQYTIELSKKMEDLGADGLLVVTPYYNKSTKKGLYEHFKAIAESTNLPIILYNVPSRTNVDIPADLVADLAKIDNIVGLKDSKSDIVYTMEVKKRVPEDFAIYSGNDDYVYPILACGGHGVISVMANAIPQQTHDLCQLYFDGKIQESRKLQMDLLGFIKSIFVETNPVPIKAAMAYIGYDSGSPRLPLFEAEDSTKDLVEKELKGLGVI